MTSSAFLSKFRRSGNEARKDGDARGEEAKVGGNKDEINSRLYCALKVAGNLFNDLADRHRGGLRGRRRAATRIETVARSFARKCARGLEQANASSNV